MFKLRFRVLIQHSDEAAINVKSLLNKEGIKVYDLRETEILNDSDNSKVSDIYILCCFSSRRNYIRFKHKHQYEEEIYEGFKTLY